MAASFAWGTCGSMSKHAGLGDQATSCRSVGGITLDLDAVGARGVPEILDSGSVLVRPEARQRRGTGVEAQDRTSGADRLPTRRLLV